MYISSFHIDGFGIFSNAGVSDLPPGMVIFLGANEAGKSTCLEFRSEERRVGKECYS